MEQGSPCLMKGLTKFHCQLAASLKNSVLYGQCPGRQFSPGISPKRGLHGPIIGVICAKNEDSIEHILCKCSVVKSTWEFFTDTSRGPYRDQLTVFSMIFEMLGVQNNALCCYCCSTVGGSTMKYVAREKKQNIQKLCLFTSFKLLLIEKNIVF